MAYNDLLGGLAALKRRARLTNQGLTGNDVLNIQDPYFAAYRAGAGARSANQQFEQNLAESKRQAEATLSQQQDQFNQTMQQNAELAGEQQMAGMMQSGIGAVGTGLSAYNLLRTPTPATPGAPTEPGLMSKGLTGAKGLVNNLTGKEIFNTSSTLAEGGGTAAAGTVGAEVASEAGMDAATQAAMDAGIDTITPGILAANEAAPGLFSSAGSALGGLGGALSYAAPYYALAKLGGAGINAVTANNPWMRDTPFGLLGETLDEPLAVESALGKAMARHGIGSEEMWETTNNYNPLEVGGWLDDTTDKATANLANILTGGAVGPVKQLGALMKELGVSDNDNYIVQNLASGGWSSFGDIGKGTKPTINAVGNILTLGLYSLFCFAAGTPITMADGTTKPVEEIDIGEECEIGGIVNGKGVVLAADIYDYEGVKVTGSHAVYEDGEWIRIKDSAKSIRLAIEKPVKVYILNNEDHILMVNGITFADYGEVTNSEDMTAQQRLEWLNENRKVLR